MNTNSRNPASETSSIKDGIEFELGVPIPGRILPAEQWVKTGIKQLPPPGPIDWSQVFGRTAPVVLDIGCGNGRFVISSAFRRPEVDHVGIDILPLVIRYATRRGNQRGLANTRFAVCDGFAFLDEYIAPRSIAEIHIYHPQPFHDPENQHRRLMMPQFIGLVHRSLGQSGQLMLQTDNRPYWEYIRNVVSSVFEWSEQTTAWPEDPLGRSRREFIATQKKLPIFRAVANRRDNLDQAELESILAGLPNPDFLSKATNSGRKPKRRLHRRDRR